MGIKGKIWRITFAIMIGFVVLFLFRLMYGYTAKFQIRDSEYIGSFFDDGMTKRNYASSNYGYEKYSKGYSEAGTIRQAQRAAMPIDAPSAHKFDINQKYEKTANLKSKSANFETDKKQVEDSIKSFNAIIQYESKAGNKGNRQWHLSLGVRPDKFEAFYEFIRLVGKLKSAEVTKVDKTNEFNKLNAKKASLEKIRASLSELSKHQGEIDEFINLQNRILEVESQLQDLGVLLGDFDEENEFCTIKYALLEGKPPVAISFLHRLKVAFEWTVKFYLQFLLIVVFATFSALFILLIIDKLQMFSGLIKKLNEQ